MTRNCVVPGCKSSHKTPGVRFCGFPSKKENLCKLSSARFAKWTEALGFRSHYNPEYKFVCSLHFVSGKAARTTDVNNVDWVPTLSITRCSEENISSLLGGLSEITNDTVLKTNYDAFVREIQDDELACSSPKKKLRLSSSSDLGVGLSGSAESIVEELPRKVPGGSAVKPSVEDTSAAMPTGSSYDHGQENGNCGKCSEVSEKCRLEVAALHKRIDVLKEELEKHKRGLNWIVDDERCKRYTGLSHYSTLKRVYKYVEGCLFEPYCELTKDQMFIMTLRKLRTNQSLVELADDYEVSTNTASKYFHRTVFVLHENLKYALNPVPREISIRHLPQIFKDHFGNRRVLIIDCFEVGTERPADPKAANTHHSAYKAKHTAKFLIAMDAIGCVAFISNAYGGRCSDRFIAQTSGFLDVLQDGDVVLADKGFDIADLVKSKGATLNIPTFLKKNTQLNPVDIEEDKQLTALRVHIERLIGVIKSKYTYLNGPILAKSLSRSENSINSVDLVARVCCMLVNLNKSIV